MKKHFFALLAAMAVTLTLSSCSDDDNPGGSEGKTLKLTTEEVAVANGLNDFQANFFKSSCATAESNDKNVIVSPLSASILTSMLANCCTGDALKEITDAMGCNSINEVNSFNATVLPYLPSADRNVTLKLANSVWHSSSLSLNPSFKSSLTDFYHASTTGCDFSKTSSVESNIFKWCEKNTGGHIKEMDLGLNEMTKIVVLNAIYFDGKWKEVFEKSKTNKRKFYGLSVEKNVDMMHCRETSVFVTANDFRAARKSFGRNNAFDVWFVLPNEGTDINKVANEIDIENLNNDAYNADVTLSAPKFAELSETMDLKTTLKNMGIKSIFESGSFTPFVEKFIGAWEIKQKTYVEFDEEGAKAAAVSSGNGWIGADTPTVVEEELILNRPFLFLITERATSSIIMAGRIVNL